MGLSRASFLPDEADCADTWRQLRWPDGLRCPDCESEDIQIRQRTYRGHLRRYRCRACDRWFSDTTDTFLSHSNVSLARWVYLIREMDKERSISDIARDLDLTYKTVLRMAHTIREVLYERREVWLRRLRGELEADDVHVKGGQQGREVEARPARRRGLSRRGRGSYESDRPLVVLWAERGERGGRHLELRRTAGKRSLLSSALSHVEAGSQIDTDTWGGYQLLEAVYTHRTVKHSERYVSEEGAHCNTAEGEWSIFKPWWRTFRGVAKRHLYLYVTEYSFRRSYRHRSRLERTRAVLGFLWTDAAWAERVSASGPKPDAWSYVQHST